MQPLPIDPHLDTIRTELDRARRLIVVAPPGAGKTTRVPPALVGAGRVIVLQPRRVAARALAQRIAAERGWTIGAEVGWHVRMERRFRADTQVIVATEGILTARLASDPLLEDFQTVILDEFHERSIHADLALALVAQAAAVRDDLRIVVMSATLDAGPIAAFLGDCPIVTVAARTHPVAITYAAERSPEAAVRAALARPGGHILCFLPGAGEIRRVTGALAGLDPVTTLVLPLHGSLTAEAQDRALAPSERRKIVLATNLAETSLTVDGVTDVIDCGTHKVPRFDPGTAIDRLETERIAADSAEQRAGRAGRTGPGRAIRLWDRSLTLRPAREPDVRRIDLAGPLLDILAWGGHPRTFAWFEAPPPERVTAGLELLALLGAVTVGAGSPRLTPLGARLRRLPLHPRLGRVLLAAGGSSEAAAACAVLSERDFLADTAVAETTECDVAARIDRIGRAPESIRAVARELERIARPLVDGVDVPPPVELQRALLAGYPDRVGQRREPGSDRILLSSGTGALLARRSGVREAEFVLALDATAGRRGPGSEAVIYLASSIKRDWLQATERDQVAVLDGERVRAIVRERYGAIVIRESRADADPTIAKPLLVAALAAANLPPEFEQTLRRLAFARIEVARDELLSRACAGRTSLPRLGAGLDLLSYVERARLTVEAPEAVGVPSGRRARLDYQEDGSVVLAIKLQELFGLADGPRVGARREPVTLSLLGPGGRPVQTTRDLRGFWERTYPEVRRELRGRYPKHPWPEDPWTAAPTARATRRR